MKLAQNQAMIAGLISNSCWKIIQLIGKWQGLTKEQWLGRHGFNPLGCWNSRPFCVSGLTHMLLSCCALNKLLSQISSMTISLWHWQGFNSRHEHPTWNWARGPGAQTSSLPDVLSWLVGSDYWIASQHNAWSLFFPEKLKIQKNQWSMLEGFHTWTQNAISKIHIFKQFSEFSHIRFANISWWKSWQQQMQLTTAALAVKHILDCFGWFHFCLFCSPFQCTYYNIAVT